mmetsp:Transcript_147375/g.274651  ORF Transcript_147375/g.274651 Transcript_147375/m.274651 type:complete len:551 (+) Transcript_147375:59-1711(+)
MRAYQTFSDTLAPALDVPVSPGVKKNTKEKLAPLVAEFSGTFVLVFIVACCKYQSDDSYGIVVTGLTYMVLIYSLAGVSGAHLNPSVTLMMALTRKLGVAGVQAFLLSAQYIVLQLLGGILGGLASGVLFQKEIVVSPISPFQFRGGMWMEFMYTAFLCFVTANVIASKRNNPKEDQNQFYALAIGFAFIAGGCTVCNISGAYLNPAVVFGLDPNGVLVDLKGLWHKFIMGEAHFSGGFLFMLAEALGGVAAAYLFLLLRFEDHLDDGHAFRTFAPPLFTRLMTEFFGTFTFVLTVGLNIILGSTTAFIPAAATFICLIYAVGNVSGGHFNPAVTLAVRISGRRRCSTEDCVFYILVQAVASFIAACFIYRYHLEGPFSDKVYHLAPVLKFGWGQVLVSELTFTFLIAYVVLCVATVEPPQSKSTKQNFFFALAIGSCVAVAGVCIGGVSGASINPAVTLGVSLESSFMVDSKDLESKAFVTPEPGYPTALVSSFWKSDLFINFLWYCFSEFGGGILAALAFHVTHRKEFKKHMESLMFAKSNRRAFANV